MYSTQCVIRGKTHRLDFEIVCTSQKPLLSGETCKRLGLMHFTIPKELNKVEHCKTGELTRDCLINTYNDVFTSPVKSLPGSFRVGWHRSDSPVRTNKCPVGPQMIVIIKMIDLIYIAPFMVPKDT